ncbi:unnamed protein product [Darwinula stevensoni]|uniref:G-protein coupled receptors family 1 profile domain-containing protein n=1 Tax=Darwinula stevensoni TaxID=69355 RepID=A0A7R8ZXG8_9CRUS|nr:unnamed protein product [Darwinula stevensoni]CAG0879335.1 unnamed protein product [Darwinula stevensoni]
MRTVPNLFIMNLAVADLLVLVVCLPSNLMTTLFDPWMWGALMCKMVSYIQGVSVTASVHSLVAVSFDRFLAIWFPLQRQMTRKAASIIIVFIWLESTHLLIPWAIVFHAEDDRCREEWTDPLTEKIYFIVANLVICYLAPLLLISICYILIFVKVCRRDIPGERTNYDQHVMELHQRSKFKVIQMLLVVVVIFILSWFPTYLMYSIYKLGDPQLLGDWAKSLIPIAQWLGVSNSCMNPILYAFFNKKFRKGFSMLVRGRGYRTSFIAPNSGMSRGETFRSSFMSSSVMKKFAERRRRGRERNNGVLRHSIRLSTEVEVEAAHPRIHRQEAFDEIQEDEHSQVPELGQCPRIQERDMTRQHSDESTASSSFLIKPERILYMNRRFVS